LIRCSAKNTARFKFGLRSRPLSFSWPGLQGSGKKPRTARPSSRAWPKRVVTVPCWFQSTSTAARRAITAKKCANSGNQTNTKADLKGEPRRLGPRRTPRQKGPPRSRHAWAATRSIVDTAAASNVDEEPCRDGAPEKSSSRPPRFSSSPDAMTGPQTLLEFRRQDFHTASRPHRRPVLTKMDRPTPAAARRSPSATSPASPSSSSAWAKSPTP